jgi:hypothetical protein
MMKLKIIFGLALAAAVMALGFAQRPDLKSRVNGYVTLVPAVRANSAATGRTVDLANYASAMMVVVPDSIDTGQPSFYVVLQDSGTAWAAVDSVQVDSAAASNGSANWLEVGYTGGNRYLRAVQRASGAAGDSIMTAVFILRGNCRVEPC